MNRLAGFFADADLRAGYDGLSVLAKKRGIDLMNLPKGQFVAFVNTRQDKLKLCAQGDVVAYLRLNGRKIDPRVIARLPQFFNGGVIEYDKALTAALRPYFPNYFKTQPTTP